MEVQIQEKRKKVIVEKVDRVVIYDSEKKEYEKYLYPKFSQRIKILLGLKKAPGKNVYFLSKIFKKANINTYEVVSYTKYSYVTKEIEGMTLLEAVIENKENKELIFKYLDEYFRIIKKIKELGIYFGDFYFNNFMVDKNNELYIIDIDDMERTFYSRAFKNKKFIPRLRKTFKIQLKRLKEQGVDINFDIDEII